MDDFGQLIGYLIAALFFLAPRLLKAFKNKAVATGKKPGRRQPTASRALADPQVDPLRVTRLADEVRALSRRHAELKRLCAVHRGAAGSLGAPISQILTASLSSLEQPLAVAIAQHTALKQSQVSTLTQRLTDLTRTVELLEHLVDQRIRPATAKLVGSLDVLAQDCLDFWINATANRGVSYPSQQAIVMLGEPGIGPAYLLSQVSLAPVVVPIQKAERIEGLLAIPHGVALDMVHSVPGLLRRLERYSPAAHHLARLGASSDPSVFTAVLASDAIAALSMGPAYCAGLAGLVEASAQPSFADVPATIRLYAACLAVELAGHAGEGQSRFAKVTARLEAAPLTAAVLPHADAIVRDAVSVVATATGVGADPERQRANHARMQAVQQRLATGASGDATARQTLGAALLAYEHSASQESRIVAAVLAQHAPVPKARRRQDVPLQERVAPLNLAQILSNRALIVDAIAVGAAFRRLSPAPRNNWRRP